jgi:hypothetical protein
VTLSMQDLSLGRLVVQDPQDLLDHLVMLHQVQ